MEHNQQVYNAIFQAKMAEKLMGKTFPKDKIPDYFHGMVKDAIMSESPNSLQITGAEFKQLVNNIPDTWPLNLFQRAMDCVGNKSPDYYYDELNDELLNIYCDEMEGVAEMAAIWHTIVDPVSQEVVWMMPDEMKKYDEMVKKEKYKQSQISRIVKP